MKINKIRLILKPSNIHGIGVFTLEKIKAKTKLPLFYLQDWEWVKRCPKGSYKRYCVSGDGGYYIPEDWNRMSIGWYLNHSAKPNVDCSKEDYETIRYIDSGEELTIDYRLLEDVK